LYQLHLSSIEEPATCRHPDLVRLVLHQCEEQSRRRYKTQHRILLARQRIASYILRGLDELSKGVWSLMETDRPATLCVPLSKHGYSGDGPLAGHSHVAARDVIEALLTLGLIEVEAGGLVDDQHFPSKLWPTKKFLSEHAKSVTWLPRKVSKSDPIILKNFDPVTKESYRVSFADTPAIRRMRKNLKRINQALLDSAIALAVDEFLLWRIRSRMSQNNDPKLLVFDRVELRRIFARSSFEYGGRFYGGWWQSVPSEYRRFVTINGQPTVEIDYSTLHPLMLYAIHGEDPPPGDLYDVWIESKDPPRVRRIIKATFNAILNDASGYYKIPDPDLTFLGMSNAQVRTRIFKKHPLLRQHIRQGVGLKLQFLDAQIAERVMLTLIDSGTIALPVHDSFLVPAHREDDLKEVMIEAYNAEIGGKPLVKDAVIGQSLIDSSFFPSGAMDLTYERNLHRDSYYHGYLRGFFEHQATVKRP